MGTAATCRVVGSGVDQRPQQPGRRFGVTVLSRDRERRLYFVATVVLAAWALLCRLF
jgi:hypothetical protein